MLTFYLIYRVLKIKNNVSHLIIVNSTVNSINYLNLLLKMTNFIFQIFLILSCLNYQTSQIKFKKSKRGSLKIK